MGFDGRSQALSTTGLARTDYVPDRNRGGFGLALAQAPRLLVVCSELEE